MDKDWVSKDTPGPGSYGYKTDFKKGVKNALGKFNPPPKKPRLQKSLDPVGSYDQQNIRLRKRAPKCTFGSAG